MADSYPARVVAVGADRYHIAALERAEAAGVPAFVVPPAAFPRRSDWDLALGEAVAAHQPDLVVCAGFMRVLGPEFLRRFAPGVINSHPALLPAFPGAHAVRDALAYGVMVTGATVHCVDAGVDTGPVIAQVAVPVHSGDDEATLHERIKTVERRLLADTVATLAGGFRLDGRKVVLA
jgi:phosphoribosylglycinamide formyltransferase-1